MEEVVLVDENDSEVGTMEKMAAHREGRLHRAFSVLVYNSKGDLLIHRRAASKYHSAGLWTNACCSHPRPGENIRDAAVRRLKEEMNILVEPEFLYKFVYRINLEDSLVEHEMDYVFRATFDGEPSPNANEVQAWRFVSVDELLRDVAGSPFKYTYWFRIILDRRYPGLLEAIWHSK